MKTIYRLNTEDYKPISYKDNYLYEQHKRIVSFLKSRLDSSKIRKILKPKLASTTLEWQGDFDVEMRPIDHASSEEKVKIEKEYLALIEEVEKLIKRMKNSGDADQIEWANFLAQVFRVENNMIVYEGKDWAFIWGWEFKSKLTILNPDFVGIPDSTVTEAVTEPVTKPDPQPGPEVEEIIIVDPPWPPPPPPPVKARRLTFFDYIRRFLRWFAYRFWALMLLILLILLIICLCRRCCREEIDCSEFNNKIGLIDDNLNCCCNSADSPNNITEIPNNPVDIEEIPEGDNNFPCNADVKAGSDGITESLHYFQNNPPGNVTLTYDMENEPDKLEVFHNGELVATTKSVPGNSNGFVGNNNNGGCCGSLTFYYSAKGDNFCKVVVTGGNSTSWQYTLGCPQ